MGFAETFFQVVGPARRPTLELVSRIDFAASTKPWLVMLYQVIRGTAPVLEYALSGLTLLTPRASDKERQALRDYYEKKLEEESEHEAWLLEDLEAVGVMNAGELPSNPFIAEMVGRQYYLVDFEHPSAYLGFIGLLEGFPPTLGEVADLELASGLPSEAFRTIRHHASADVAHREELALVLDEVPESQHPAIVGNALRCVALHAGALAHVVQEMPQ